MSGPSSENNVLGHFFLNYKHILIDEIALEGLEGIGLDLLWRRIEHRISTLVTDKMKARFWQSILNSTSISLYELPEPLPNVEIRDRFLIVDEETGDLKDPDDYLDGPYEYSPIPNEYGSCKYYYTRRHIPSQQLLGIPFGKIEAGYGGTLVLVASLEERWKAMVKHLPITCLQHMTAIQYCILELIGKSRENGQMSIGKTNLANIIKEPKNLFYNRRLLRKLDVIKVLSVTQTLGPRAVKSLLLRLNRFHKPLMLSLPKTGKTHKIIEYLSKCPRYAAKANVMLNLGLYNRMQTKKIKKNNNVLDFIELDDDEEPPKKKLKNTPLSMQTKRRFMCIVSKSDESSQSEDEGPVVEPVKYQYKIGVSLMRQAYERLLDAGLKGISQTELGQILGIEFYTTRMLCRILKAKKIVREFFEDKGRQRISRYVAVATGQDDANYLQEKKKFLDYMIQNHEGNFDTPSAEMIVPDLIEESSENLNEQESRHISEVTVSTSDKIVVQSLIESKKSLTLRQLKFGNGVIKIVKEKQCVTGYQTLSNLVAKEINDTPMVTKALKIFLQKLVAAGQVKIYKVKWPGPENVYNFLNLICAPHIKATDPVVRTKYKEVQLRAMAKKVPQKKDTIFGASRPLTMFINPRYMKIQKLHEFIINLTYFDPTIFDSNFPTGYLSMTDLMPEMTVKFAISNMSTSGIAEISYLRILDQHLPLKLKDAPPEIAHAIMKCRSLRNAMRLNLKALAMYGLIQLVYQPDVQTEDYTNSTLFSFLFYVNRHATLLNTTGTWPRDIDFESLERRYYFSSFENVKDYWSDAYDISIETKMVLKKNRTKKTLNPPVRREEEVSFYDNGSRYGDGKGPCGLDSCFHMEIVRLWRTYFVKQRDAKPTPTPLPKKNVPNVKIPKLAKSKQPKPPKKKKAPPKVKNVMKLKTVTRGRKRIPEMTVTWNKEEDFIIVLCQAAITIASPSSQPGCLRVRNIVAKDILTLRDSKKTQSVCHRRALMLQLNPTLMHEKDKLLNEMRRRRPLIIKYEGLIKKLRLRYSTNMTKFMNEARIPVLELVWLIWQVSKSESYNRRMPCVALSVDDFHDSFTIVPATANKIYNIYKSPELSILRESVFLTVMLTLNNEMKPETARKIYVMFKSYPENCLRVAVDQLRRSGAISAKEKLFNNQMHRLHLEDIVQSSYKISASYQRRWIGRLNSEFAVSLSKMIDADLPTSNIKGSAELNCILCELQALDVLEVVTTTKPAIVAHTADESFKEDEYFNVIDIETKHKLKSGAVSWRVNPEGSTQWDMKTVASCYTDIEYEPFLEQLKKNAEIVPNDELEYNLEDIIIQHLEDKENNGSSFKELQDITRYDTEDLAHRLYQLELKGFVKRVGMNDNILVLTKFIRDWALKVIDRYLIITPWLTLDCDIRYDILLEWAGVIVNKIFECPGCSIVFLSDTFELITCRAVQDACMFLQYVKCISIKIVKCSPANIWTDDDEEPQTSEFHPYESAEHILCYPAKNSITKYVYLRKVMLQKYLKDRNS